MHAETSAKCWLWHNCVSYCTGAWYVLTGCSCQQRIPTQLFIVEKDLFCSASAARGRSPAPQICEAWAVGEQWILAAVGPFMVWTGHPWLGEIKGWSFVA